MPSLGGFYMSPVAWMEWLHTQNPPYKQLGPPTAEVMILRKMSEKNIRNLFNVDMVPIPVTEPQERTWGLMVYRRRDKQQRVYLPPRDESEVDQAGKQMLEELIGLKVSEWCTLWYDAQSEDEYAEFLVPPEGGE
ncbi:hypothetical protein FRC10_008230 [Ceratobasidium sp. 414]|nr:hypothetical protein FRC10_008230 [Ceratobasidium sp. 414]